MSFEQCLFSGYSAQALIFTDPGLTHAPWRKRLQFLVARFVNQVTLSFGDFQPQTLNCARKSARKSIANLSKNKITCNFFCLRRLRILDERMPQMKIFLLYFCGHDAVFAMYPITSKKSIVTCVYQLCLLAFTKFNSLCRLGFTMPRCNYFSIQDWVRIH